MLQKPWIASGGIVYWTQLKKRLGPGGPGCRNVKNNDVEANMVHSLYQSLNNLETIYADRIGIRYYDEAKGGVVEVPFRQYAVDYFGDHLLQFS